MLYALIVNNALWLVGLAVLGHQAIALHRRVVALQDAREDKYRDHIERLENQIILLKVSPVTAVAVAANTEVPDDSLSLSDDEALAEYELERAGLK